MNLYDAIKRYLVYLQASRTPARELSQIRLVMQDVLGFYGRETDLDSFDDHTVLDYVRVNDPFDLDLVASQRGETYCQLIDWLMRNQMIPAWAEFSTTKCGSENFASSEALNDRFLS